MEWYRPAGQDIFFSCPLPELAPYKTTGTENAVTVPLPVSSSLALTCQIVGAVGGEQRKVEIWSASPGVLLKVAGGSDFYIAPAGQGIVRVDVSKADWQTDQQQVLGLDREILLGPALVLALAQRGTWCLHASAASFTGKLIVFLGESGQGKSTLAGYLDAEGGLEWRRIADDILPVNINSAGVDAWPRFPQLKLSQEAQPGPDLSERIPLDRICVLTQADKDDKPDLQLLARSNALQALLSHTAGARLFDTALLAGHLAFCGGTAGQIPVYRLAYPHRRDALRQVKDLLEGLH